MLFIVAHHFGVHGQYGGMEMSGFNSFIIKLLSAGGKLGVNIYVLISGYFLVKSEFKIRRVVNTIVLTIFYSVAIYLILLMFLPGFNFELSKFASSLFVIYSGAYWFVTCYIAMVLLSPFINKLIGNLNKREHQILIALLLFIQVQIPGLDSYISLSETGWFITLYIIAAYISLYPIKLLENKTVTGILCIVFCSVVGLWGMATGMKNIICLATSILLFCFFNSLKIKNNKFINLISKTTFAVYLIHDNNYIRPLLWGRLLNCPFHATQGSFWLFSATAVLLVFVVCSLIETVRILLTKPLIRFVDNKIEKHFKAKKSV